jgi:hypothetical protein
MSNYNVIFHIDENHKWKLVLANTQNLIHALSDHTLTIEILANAEAVQYLVRETLNQDEYQLLNTLSKNVTFSACNNSLKSLHIDPSHVLSFVNIVPSGVAELTIKQHAHFAYIKP